MNDITPKEAIEILSHYTDLGYGVVIEGENTSKIKQALSLASKALAVEHSLLPLSGEADNAYMRGYEVGKAEGILKAETRPQGNQIAWEQGYEAGLAQGKHNKPQVTVFAENADEKAVADLKAELENVIEARPKGEWKTVEGYDGDEYYECSNCGEPWFLSAGTPKDNNMNFCPNCGADMRGGAE